MIRFLLLVSRQGKARLIKFYDGTPIVERTKIVRDVTARVTSRPLGLSLVMDDEGGRLVYKRYASLYFILGLEKEDNELVGLELIHHLVEMLDRYFGNVCELDLIFNFHKVHMIVDDVIMDGRLQETSKKCVLRLIAAQDVIIEDSHHNNQPSLLGTDFNRKVVHTL